MQTFLDQNDRPPPARYQVKMGQIYEIHKHRGGDFMYIVARTNKHSEEYVRSDVDKMNNMLTPEMKAEGITYVFTFGTVDSMAKKTGERKKKEKQNVMDVPV